MSKYIFKKVPNPDNRFDTDEIKFTVNAESLPELLESFSFFLKACGFTLAGELDIVDTELEDALHAAIAETRYDEEEVEWNPKPEDTEVDNEEEQEDDGGGSGSV